MWKVDQDAWDRENAEREVNWNRRPARTPEEKAARENEVVAVMNRMRNQRANDDMRNR